jgi:hypothetical protein
MARQRPQHFLKKAFGGVQITPALVLDGGVEGLARALFVHGPVGSRF